MSFETILTAKENQTGTISLNRPKQFNTFSTKMAEELNETLLQMEQDETIRVVIVRGEGKVFSTGIDVSEFEGKTSSEYHAWIKIMDEMHLTIASMGKPVIASIHGFAVANGAGLLAAADFAIASEETKIGTSAINVGLLCSGPIAPLSYFLPKKKALEMLLCGDMIDAKEAERLGILNKVVPLEKLKEETEAFARKLIDKSPVAVRIGKEFYYEMMDMSFRQKLALAGEVLTRLCTTEDAREGVSAFLEKRKPEWKSW